jgi:hypothetical protein
VTDWEYRKIDLNLHRPQGDELDLLNAAGAEGWELVGITSNSIAYLKRELEELQRQPGTPEPRPPHLPEMRMQIATTRGELERSR